MAGVPQKTVESYLRRKAEPEARAADRLDADFGHALVLPVYGERDSLFATLGSVPKGPRGDVLLIVVLNARADSPQSVHAANRVASERLLAASQAVEALWADPPIVSASLAHGRLVLVDRAAPGHFLPEGQGVGLARKIGSDLALRLRRAGRLVSDWIHTTDADALLPNDYFEQVSGAGERGTAAALYPFEHRFDPDPSLARAGRLHEISLRYDTLGLAWAGSPYAYQSLGSCLAIRCAAYAEAGGFPKRNALEDVHVLNRLAKIGAIVRLPGAPLTLEGRLSDRVPVGTGQTLARLASGRDASAGLRLHHPAAFAHLAAWLRVLARIARTKGDVRQSLADLPAESPFFRRDLLIGALERIGLFRAIPEAIQASPDEESLLCRLHQWLDAPRTQRLLSALRAGGLPSLPFRRALAEAPFTGLSDSTEEDLEELRRALALREQKLAGIPTGVPSLVRQA